MEQIIKCAGIFDRLENQPHLQDLIKGHYMSSLAKDHEEHDKKKLIKFNETNSFGVEDYWCTDGTIDSRGWEYGRNRPLVPSGAPTIHQDCLDELEDDIENLKLCMRRYVVPRMSRRMVDISFHLNYYKFAVDTEYMRKIWLRAARLREKKAKKNSTILIQSVVRGWLVRRETK